MAHLLIVVAEVVGRLQGLKDGVGSHQAVAQDLVPPGSCHQDNIRVPCTTPHKIFALGRCTAGNVESGASCCMTRKHYARSQAQSTRALQRQAGIRATGKAYAAGMPRHQGGVSTCTSCAHCYLPSRPIPDTAATCATWPGLPRGWPCLSSHITQLSLGSACQFCFHLSGCGWAGVQVSPVLPISLE